LVDRGVGAKSPAAKSKALPRGFARTDLVAAYQLPATGGSGRTVAVVDAHDDPTAEADLAVYRKTYGLAACTSGNGCFKKVNGRGKTSPLPPYDPSDDWSDEVSLDLDMVSAVCPDCRILLVEADDASAAALAAAERAAIGSGAAAVSNSWGADESTETQSLSSAFQHSGVAVTASSGDGGFQQAAWPASLAGVIAVGGTSLAKAPSTSRGWTESAWSGAGSGCSAYVAKPAWQHDAHCTWRTAADLSAVADPTTGLAVYAQGSWGVFGGTSASSPIIAAMIALAGNPAQLATAQYVYSHAASLNDVVSGSNAHWDCGGDYLCDAVKGYDGPTGLGTPDGLGAL
jgi:subtilase family serine protease